MSLTTPVRSRRGAGVAALAMILLIALAPLGIAHAGNVPFSFNTTLQPGVWHGFFLGPSSMNRGYVAEITPLDPGVDGETIERYVVQPEFNGSEWNDVLRVQLPGGYKALNVNIRVYDTTGLPIRADFMTTLDPGVWHGFIVGPSTETNGYVTEISPIGSGTDGETIERSVVQPEFNGSLWNDVLRAQISASYAPLAVGLRVYETGALQPAASFDATLQPGIWHGFLIGPSNADAGYVAEITPTAGGVNGQTVQRYVIQPEFNGSQWNDVLRVQILPTDSPMAANLRVYRIDPGIVPATKVTWGTLKTRYR